MFSTSNFRNNFLKACLTKFFLSLQNHIIENLKETIENNYKQAHTVKDHQIKDIDKHSKYFKSIKSFAFHCFMPILVKTLGHISAS